MISKVAFPFCVEEFDKVFILLLMLQSFTSEAILGILFLNIIKDWKES